MQRYTPHAAPQLELGGLLYLLTAVQVALEEVVLVADTWAIALAPFLGPMTGLSACSATSERCFPALCPTQQCQSFKYDYLIHGSGNQLHPPAEPAFIRPLKLLNDAFKVYVVSCIALKP